MANDVVAFSGGGSIAVAFDADGGGRLQVAAPASIAVALSGEFGSLVLGDDAPAGLAVELFGARSSLVLQADASPDLVVALQAFMRGAPGPRGPAGPSGPTGGDYLEVAFAAALQVLINHNFGRRPAVQILSPGSLLVSADVAHVSVDQVRIDFTLPQAGLALLTA